jgi:hypothetical protein
MAKLYGQTLKERKELERLTEQKILHALVSRSKELEQAKREKRQKKKTVGELLSLVNICGIQGRALRPAHEYVPRSYNLDKQVTGLLNHMFARYPVPGFLYQACRKVEDSFEKRHEMYRQWFVTLAQGGSFPKLVKPYMTGREAFVFLSMPAGGRIHENVWRAKMKVAGLPVMAGEKLIERILGQYFFDEPDGRLAEVIQFFARNHGDMSRTTFGEIVDFLEWKLRNDRGFRLKGRTISSVVKLTNEWHVLMQKAGLGHRVEWKGCGIADWEHVAKDVVWRVAELRSNRDLINEGRKQKHCVYSYVHACASGRVAIFSMRAYAKRVTGYTEDGDVVWDGSCEHNRITIEVTSDRTIVQVRGHLNRLPTDDEKKILRLWAGEKGLIVRWL